MKTRLFAITVLLMALPAYTQKKPEKPKVHADFQFGSYPTSREALETMSNEQARLIAVGSAEGWDSEKIAKQYKLNQVELIRVSDKLEDERLVGRSETDDYMVRPLLPVIRERDWDRVKDGLQRHTLEFSKLLESHWTEIEGMVAGLEGAKSVPMDRQMYETVVSGILLGGMVDAFYDDKTLMTAPPRRGKNGNERFYAWLVESNPEAAGKLKRELRESDNYRIISIGTELPQERLDVGDLRGKGTVYEDADALKYRRFIAVFSRDKLMPYFKSHRSEFLAQGALMSSGSYTSFREVFAWYYNTMANGTVDQLVAARRMAAPEKSYTYAVRIPQ